MGTWGPGNFENDTAAEYYSDLCRPLIAQIRNTVSDATLMQPDEPDSEIMLAYIEILTVLAQNVGRSDQGGVGDFIFPFPFPASDEISTWKQKYLEVWDNYIDALKPDPTYKEKRRAIIEKTFDRFIKIAEAGPPADG